MQNNQLLIQRSVVIGVGLAIIGLIAWSVYLLLPHSSITLQIAPKQANLTIDNSQHMSVTRGQKIRISPGQHTLSLSRSEFSTEQTTVNLKNGETQTITLALTPQTDNAWNIMRSDPDSMTIYQLYNDKKTSSTITSIQSQNPLYEKLPLNTREYYIYLCPSLKHPTDKLKKAICVIPTVDATRQLSLDALKSAGFDLSKEEVYVSLDETVLPIIDNDQYTISYYRDLSTSNKPTFSILIPYKTMDPQAYQSYLTSQRDKALAALTQAGYSLPDITFVYINPELVKYNTSKDIVFPGTSDAD